MLTKWVPAVVLTASALLTGLAPEQGGGPSLPNNPIAVPTPARPDGATGNFGQGGDNGPSPTGPVVDVALKVDRDGGLSVTEKVTVPGGQKVVRSIPERVPASDGQDRVYTIKDPKATGAGSVSSGENQVVLTAPAGQTTLTYTVDGSVADLAGAQEVRWQVAGGWDTKLDRVTASFVAPLRATPTQDCFAGPVGSAVKCTLSEVDHTGIIRVEQDGLAVGHRVDLAVSMPLGTVPSNARFVQTATVANAFSLTPAVGIGFAVLALLLLLGGLAVWWLRRRDAASPVGVTRAEVLMRENGHVHFASPDGILPGQIGTVVDETVDVIDISATVVDLAVRNYLWVAEIPGESGFPDWQLSRRNPPDEHLREFERAIYDALLPDGTQAVLLSRLRASGSLDLRKVADTMYTDVVAKGWFSRRPDSGRNLVTWLGLALAVLGVVSTVVLTFTAGYALLGVAAAVAGIALAFGAGWLPSRTARGRALVSQVHGLLAYLHTAAVGEIPERDKEMVFSRSLPYALVLGDGERWLRAFVGFNPSADGSAGLYWFGGMESDTDLRRFGPHFTAFVAALDGLLAESGHLRSIRPEPVPA
ncbi:MAG: Conserved putative secreted protein [Amycolatopsis sp.]|uniref:DUF2207 domain-containing protein n=1 Tax=Amycolatopsis sp. TaxID=37632 RepID=UPI00261C6E1A|nr:DUF2207 domain-containing protein [Amycolatopsis sp.]MCU1682069.1 Conserved putative secreted protein [Amycolatopsis sp.]